MNRQGQKTGLKAAIVGGQLVHYVTVGGQSLMGHTTLKAAMCAAVSAMAISS